MTGGYAWTQTRMNSKDVASLLKSRPTSREWQMPQRHADAGVPTIRSPMPIIRGWPIIRLLWPDRMSIPPLPRGMIRLQRHLTRGISRDMLMLRLQWRPRPIMEAVRMIRLSRPIIRGWPITRPPWPGRINMLKRVRSMTL